MPLILGACGLIGFGFYEIYIARNPVIPSNLFRQPTALVNYFGTFIHGVVLWSLLYYLPLYYEGVKNYSPLIVGVAVFPETFTVAPASVIVGVLMSRKYFCTLNPIIPPVTINVQPSRLWPLPMGNLVRLDSHHAWYGPLISAHAFD